MFKGISTLIIAVILVYLSVTAVFSGYHHMGEKDLPEFLKALPATANSKLDSCALCHSGGQYENRAGMSVSMGSCQWCHYRYGYDGKGDISATINPYGRDYLENGRNAAAIIAINTKDSDGDGFTNEAEIAAVRFPGSREDDPLKTVAPSVVYTRRQLEALPRQTQFLLMSASKSEDFYAEYRGVAMETLLRDAGVSDKATGIRVYSPDGWSQYHPLDPDPDPSMYHVRGTYPEAVYQYDERADKVKGGWVDYSAPSARGRKNNDRIDVPGGLRLMLAYQRDGKDLTPGVLSTDNKLDGEGPYRIIVPQKIPNPPDQSSSAANQDVIWPYKAEWDHSAGASTRSATIIKVEPLPEGSTDIDLLEAGWEFVDEGKIVIYGAIKEPPKQ